MNNVIENAINTTVSTVSVEMTTRELALKKATESMMLIPDFCKLSPSDTTAALLALSQAIVVKYNSNLDKSQAALKWSMPKNIEPFQLAMCLIKRNNAINLSYVDNDSSSEVALYDESEGIYTVNVDDIMREILSYSTSANKSFTDEVFVQLRALAPRRSRTIDVDLIPVNNGIYNYKTKQLMNFSPDFVFLTKSRTNYNSNATNVIIHNEEDGTDWDVESWMQSLTDDPEIANLFWEITGALLRPNVKWNKSAWLYSDKGENGKGTLCAMWRNLCGKSATSISIADFSKEFMLSSLVTSQAIIVDENDVGTFIDKAGALKAVITNDVVYINRKFKDPVAYQFRGFMVQCLNELPRFKDKSDSIYRRQLFVPMTKCFTGIARTYIKDDYINRPDVLEYVMKRVLDMNYYKLSEPEACKIVLEEYKTYNDPVRQFWSEFEDQFVWDFIPYSFLYSLFKEWFKRDNPSGSIMGRNTFIKDLRNVVEKSTVFTLTDPVDAKVRVGTRMNATEYLIADYNITEWQTPGMGPTASRAALCQPCIPERASGIVRL